MNWNTVRRTLYPCPIKSIYQYKPGQNDQLHNFNGYMAGATGDTISGEWDYIFSFEKIDGNELVPHIKRFGSVMYKGIPISDPRFECLWDDGYFIYVKQLP
jgi:hypothetical protein